MTMYLSDTIHLPSTELARNYTLDNLVAHGDELINQDVLGALDKLIE